MRVRGITASGEGAPSNVVTVAQVPCTAPPQPVPQLAAAVQGSRVTLQWTAPMPGLAPGYVIEAGSAPGRSDLAVLDLSGERTTFETSAPPGVYGLRVRARNACGAGGASNEVVVAVP